MRKMVAVATFLFLVTSTSAFAQGLDAIGVFETSNDFAEIKEVFQRRLYDASSEYAYFFHQLERFDFNSDVEDKLFNKKARKAISKNQYFIFEIAFRFSDNFPSRFQAGRACSRDEIDKALADYPDL